jgi:hypothetical protein
MRPFVLSSEIEREMGFGKDQQRMSRQPLGLIRQLIQ